MFFKNKSAEVNKVTKSSWSEGFYGSKSDVCYVFLKRKFIYNELNHKWYEGVRKHDHSVKVALSLSEVPSAVLEVFKEDQLIARAPKIGSESPAARLSEALEALRYKQDQQKDVLDKAQADYDATTLSIRKHEQALEAFSEL